MRLRDASREELSDLARQELINTIEQLKAQEDIMKKQSDLARRLFDAEQQIGLLQGRVDHRDKSPMQLQENSTCGKSCSQADLRWSLPLAVSALSLILWGCISYSTRHICPERGIVIEEWRVLCT